MDNKQPATSTGLRVTAWAVHLLSAIGAVLALLALLAIDGHRWTEAMLWLFAALAVDGVDGTLARAARVKERAARIDGDALDLVVDYLNYVFVPTLFMLEAGLLPEPLAVPLAASILLSSLYVFARRDMKTDDGYFRGFPALWNLVALYLFAAGMDGAAAATIVAALIALTFAPVHFVHPFRVSDFGPWLPSLAIIWAIATLGLLVVRDASLSPVLFATSALSALAVILMGLWRSLRAKSAAEPR